MAAITWTGAAGDGNYNNPMNWSPQQVPTSADMVTISTTAATSISLGNDAVQSLTTNKFVTLDLANNTSFTIGTSTATTFSNGGTFALESGGNNTDLIVGATKLSLTGGGTVLLDNNSQDRIYGVAASDVLSNVNNLIEGGGQLGAGQLTFINGTAGTVNANDATVLYVNTGTNTITNSGLMESTGGAGLAIQSTVNNGATGRISGAGGNVYIQNTTIQGGTLSTTGTGAINVQNGYGATLDGTANAVTNTGMFDINNNGSLTVLGSLVNDGTINLQSGGNYTRLVIGSPTVTLSGHGTIALSDSSTNLIYGATGTEVLNNTNNLIEGSGALGSGNFGLSLGLINGTAGIIDATGAGTRLILNTGTLTTTNSGLIEATGPAGLQINSTVNNGTAGIIEAKGAAVTVSLDNGTDILGGTLLTAAGGVIQLETGNGATLDGTAHTVTIAGPLEVINNASLTVLGTTTNTNTISLLSGGNYTRFVEASAVGTLTGGGTLFLSDSNVNLIYGTASTNVLDNVNNTITGAGDIGNGGNLTLVNGAAGVIDASATNNALVLDMSNAAVMNSGLIEATGAAGLVISNTIVNDTTGGTILAAGSNVYLNSGTIAGGTLKTTGTGAIVINSGQPAELDGTTQAVTSLGSIAIVNNGSLTVLGTLSNHGSISLGSLGNYTRLIVGSASTADTTTLTGGGVVTLSDDSHNIIYGQLGTDTLLNLNNTISGAGNLGDGQLTLINDATIDATGTNNVLYVDSGGGAVTNNGLMEDTGVAGLVIYGTTVSNAAGTVLANTGNVYLQSGTIAGGLVETSGGGAIVVQGGQTGTLDGSASAVTSTGMVDVNNNGSLTVLGSLINQGTINLQSGGNYTRFEVASPTVTLTGSGTLALSDSSTNLIYGVAGSNLLDNVNNTITGAGALGDGQMALLNEAAGIIDASAANNVLYLNFSNGATNKGLIESTNTGGLAIQTVISNVGGQIVAAGGNIYLQNGTIQGGTLSSSGGGATIVQGGMTGTLDGSMGAVTNTGTLDITNNGSLNLLGTIANKGTIALQSGGNYTRIVLESSTVTLSGGGTVSLSDSSTNLIYGAAGSDVLDNVNNTISGAGQLGDGQMTLVNSGTIAAVGSNVLHLNLGSTGTNTATGAFLGQGAGGLSIENGTYTNSGLIEAQNGSSVTFQSTATLTNSAAGTLTGGTYGAVSKGNGATLSVNGTAITTDAANILLQGAGSVVTFGGTAIEASLTTIAKGGVLQVLGSRGYTSTLKIANSGTINLAGGTFKTKGLNDKTGSLLSGYGNIVGNLTSAGTIAATGGTLDLKGTTNTISGAESGTGTLSFDKGTTTFNTGASLGVSNIAVINAASLAIATNLSFSGVFDIVGASAISGAGTLSSSGTFEQTGAGVATIGDPFASSGTISTAAGGTLAFAGGLANTGLILDNGGFTDTAALTGGSLTVGAAGSSAVIASGAGAGNSTINTLTVGGGTLNTSGTTLTVTGDYNNTVAGVGNAYTPFAGVTGTIDGQGTQLAVVGVNGTTITSINGTLTIAIAKHGTASFVIENTGSAGSAALRGALQTTVNGGHINGTNLSGSGVTAQDFGPIAAGGMSSVFTIAYTAGSTAGDAIHFASDFANVAGLTIAITQAAGAVAAPALAPAAVSRPAAEPSAHDFIVPQHGWSAL